MTTRLFKVTDETNKNGPCFAIQERKRIPHVGTVWEWAAWSRTREDAESTARGLGTLLNEEAAR